MPNLLVTVRNKDKKPYDNKLEGTGIYAKNGNGRQTPWHYKDLKGNWYTTQGHKPNPFLQDAMDEKAGSLIDCFKELI